MEIEEYKAAKALKELKGAKEQKEEVKIPKEPKQSRKKEAKGDKEKEGDATISSHSDAEEVKDNAMPGNASPVPTVPTVSIYFNTRLRRNRQSE